MSEIGTRSAPSPVRLPLLPGAGTAAEVTGVHDKCARCGGTCCSYFALQIDSPKTYDDFDDIRWYVSHRGVQVFKEGRRWYLQVEVVCNHLSPVGLCGIYASRPKICSDHSVNNCEFENDESFTYRFHFRLADEVMAHMQRRWPKGRPKKAKRVRRALPKALRFA